MSMITGQLEAQHLLQDAAAATGNGNTLDVSRYASVTTQNIGTWTSATVTFEATIDETTWTSVQGTLKSDGTLSSTSTVTDEFRTFDVAGFVSFRARISTYGSGTLTVSARATPVESSGGAQVVIGAAATGAAEAGNPVLIAGTDGTDAQSLLVSGLGGLFLSVTGADAQANNGARLIRTSANGASDVQTHPSLFNGTLWDRQRNNEEITILASAARTANTDSADLVNYNAKGVMIILDITVDAVSVGLTLSILMKDPVSAKDVTIWTAAAAATGVGTDVYLIYPGVLAADFNGSEAVSMALPRTWVLRVTTADADEATYSIGASYIN